MLLPVLRIEQEEGKIADKDVDGQIKELRDRVTVLEKAICAQTQFFMSCIKNV
jgi:hypothetical protein